MRCSARWHRPSGTASSPDREANELAARHRASIDRFYDCGDEMHRNLVEMYLADERFTRYYDDVEPGLAQFVRDIVSAVCGPGLGRALRTRQHRPETSSRSHR